MATDSQGTLTRPFLDPEKLSRFFDKEKGWKIKTGPDGQPLLDTWSSIASNTVEMPYKVHTDVEKILSLEPLKTALMVSGIASIGDRTIKSLISEFKTTPDFTRLLQDDHTLDTIASSLLDFLRPRYEALYSAPPQPDLELMVCGYDKNRYTPGIVRILVNQNCTRPADYDFCIFLGGITREIQRLLFAIDYDSKMRLIKRSKEMLGCYRSNLERYLKKNSIEIDLPAPEEFGDELDLFKGLELGALKMNCANYSEQDAIECAEFLINIMIKSQRFSDKVPTTGGTAKIAMITKHAGFRFITPRQEYLDDD